MNHERVASWTVNPLPNSQVTKASNSSASTANNRESEAQKQSSGETTRNKRRQLTRLDLLKRKSIAVVITADLIVVGALIFQLLQLSHTLHHLFSTKVADTADYVSSGLSRDQLNMRLGITKYAANHSSAVACGAVAGDPSDIHEIHLLFLHERTNRQLEFLAVVDASGGVISSAAPAHVNGMTFNPSGIVTNYTDLFHDSGEQLSASLPVDKQVFEEMHAPEFRDNPAMTQLPSWDRDVPTFTEFVVQPLFCGMATVQAYIVWGNAITPSKYDSFSDAVDMADSGFVAVLMYDQHSDAFRTASSYLKTSETDIAHPDLSGRIPNSFLASVAEQQQVDVMGTIEIGDINYIYSANAVLKARLGDAEIDLFAPRAVYVFGLPTTEITSTVRQLLKWHVPVMVTVVVMSFITLWLLIRKFVDPMQQLLESVKKKKMAEFNESIRQMKSNKSFLVFFIIQLVAVECLLGWLMYINRQLMEDSVSGFSSASTEGPEISSLIASKHDDVAVYLQGWAGFSEIIDPTITGNFSAHVVQQLQDSTQFFNLSSICVINSQSIITMSSDASGIGKPFPIDSLIDYFANETNDSRRAIVTTTFWSPDEVGHLIPVRNDSDNIPMEPAVVKVMAAPINSISEGDDNNLIRGDVVGAIIAVDLMNGQPSLFASSVDVFNTGYFGMYSWNRANRQFQLLTSVYQKSKSSPQQLNLLLDGNYQDVLSRGLSSSFSSNQLYVEDNVTIDSRPNTVAVVPLIPLHEPSFGECTLHAYIVRGSDDSEWLLLLQEQTEFESVIMAIELTAALIGLVLTYWPMNRFLNSMQKAFNVPSMSRKERDRLEGHAATLMGLDSAKTDAGQAVHSTIVTNATVSTVRAAD